LRFEFLIAQPQVHERIIEPVERIIPRPRSPIRAGKYFMPERADSIFEFLVSHHTQVYSADPRFTANEGSTATKFGLQKGTFIRCFGARFELRLEQVIHINTSPVGINVESRLFREEMHGLWMERIGDLGDAASGQLHWGECICALFIVERQTNFSRPVPADFGICRDCSFRAGNNFGFAGPESHTAGGWITARRSTGGQSESRASW